jgi:hypothetical protein
MFQSKNKKNIFKTIQSRWNQLEAPDDEWGQPEE